MKKSGTNKDDRRGATKAANPAKAAKKATTQSFNKSAINIGVDNPKFQQSGNKIAVAKTTVSTVAPNDPDEYDFKHPPEMPPTGSPFPPSKPSIVCTEVVVRPEGIEFPMVPPTFQFTAHHLTNIEMAIVNSGMAAILCKVEREGALIKAAPFSGCVPPGGTQHVTIEGGKSPTKKIAAIIVIVGERRYLNETVEEAVKQIKSRPHRVVESPVVWE